MTWWQRTLAQLGTRAARPPEVSGEQQELSARVVCELPWRKSRPLISPDAPTLRVQLSLSRETGFAVGVAFAPLQDAGGLT